MIGSNDFIMISVHMSAWLLLITYNNLLSSRGNKQTCILPAMPYVERRSVCRERETLICNTADVMSRSEKASRRQSDCVMRETLPWLPYVITVAINAQHSLNYFLTQVIRMRYAVRFC